MQAQLNGPNSSTQSPFLLTQKNGVQLSNTAIQNGIIVTSTNNYAAKKKTVSPRNSNTAFLSATGVGASKMLLLADKNQQITADEYASSAIESSDGKNGAIGTNSINRNRLKSNNGHVLKKENGTKVEEIIEVSNIHGAKAKEYYNTEKFGQHLLMNSDSHTALAAAKLQAAGEELIMQNQGAA